MCAVQVLHDSRAIIDSVQALHRAARAACVDAYGHAAPDDPYEECGDLSEALWNRAPELAGFLQLMTQLAGSLRPEMFSDLNCRAMDDADYAAAMAVIYYGPGLVSPDFLRCAVARESDHEAMPLWTLLTAIEEIPGAETWVPNRAFRDERTLSRLGAIRGDTRTEESAP